MTMREPIPDATIQQAFDGTLDRDEAAAVRAALLVSEEGRRRLEALLLLQTRLRDHFRAETALTPQQSDALFSRITAALDGDAVRASARPQGERGTHDGIASPGQRAATPLRVVDGGNGEEEPAPARVSQAPRETWRWFVPAAVALSAAAGFALIFNSLAITPRAPRGLAGAGRGVTGLTVSALGSEVVEADFGDNVGTIFEVEGNAGEPIAVVWISDEELSKNEEIL